MYVPKCHLTAELIIILAGELSLTKSFTYPALHFQAKFMYYFPDSEFEWNYINENPLFSAHVLCADEMHCPPTTYTWVMIIGFNTARKKELKNEKKKKKGMQRYKADTKQMRHEILLPREEISD